MQQEQGEALCKSRKQSLQQSSSLGDSNIRHMNRLNVILQEAMPVEEIWEFLEKIGISSQNGNELILRKLEEMELWDRNNQAEHLAVATKGDIGAK
ncbi:hypothetical protein Ancab_038987 [Ancistrocladus abbreviatus]